MFWQTCAFSQLLSVSHLFLYSVLFVRRLQQGGGRMNGTERKQLTVSFCWIIHGLGCQRVMLAHGNIDLPLIASPHVCEPCRLTQR